MTLLKLLKLTIAAPALLITGGLGGPIKPSESIGRLQARDSQRRRRNAEDDELDPVLFDEHRDERALREEDERQENERRTVDTDAPRDTPSVSDETIREYYGIDFDVAPDSEFWRARVEHLSGLTPEQVETGLEYRRNYRAAQARYEGRPEVSSEEIDAPQRSAEVEPALDAMPAMDLSGIETDAGPGLKVGETELRKTEESRKLRRGGEALGDVGLESGDVTVAETPAAATKEEPQTEETAPQEDLGSFQTYNDKLFDRSTTYADAIANIRSEDSISEMTGRYQDYKKYAETPEQRAALKAAWSETLAALKADPAAAAQHRRHLLQQVSLQKHQFDVPVAAPDVIDVAPDAAALATADATPLPEPTAATAAATSDFLGQFGGPERRRVEALVAEHGVEAAAEMYGQELTTVAQTRATNEYLGQIEDSDDRDRANALIDEHGLEAGAERYSDELKVRYAADLGAASDMSEVNEAYQQQALTRATSSFLDQIEDPDERQRALALIDEHGLQAGAERYIGQIDGQAAAGSAQPAGTDEFMAGDVDAALGATDQEHLRAQVDYRAALADSLNQMGHVSDAQESAELGQGLQDSYTPPAAYTPEQLRDFSQTGLQEMRELQSNARALEQEAMPEAYRDYAQTDLQEHQELMSNRQALLNEEIRRREKLSSIAAAVDSDEAADTAEAQASHGFSLSGGLWKPTDAAVSDPRTSTGTPIVDPRVHTADQRGPFAGAEDAVAEGLTLGRAETETFNQDDLERAYHKAVRLGQTTQTKEEYVQDVLTAQPSGSTLLARTTADVLIPGYGTVANWQDSSGAGRAASIGLDVAGFIPGVGQVAKVVRTGAKYSDAVKSAGKAYVTAPYQAARHPIETTKGVYRMGDAWLAPRHSVPVAGLESTLLHDEGPGGRVCRRTRDRRNRAGEGHTRVQPGGGRDGKDCSRRPHHQADRGKARPGRHRRQAGQCNTKSLSEGHGPARCVQHHPERSRIGLWRADRRGSSPRRVFRSWHRATTDGSEARARSAEPPRWAARPERCSSGTPTSWMRCTDPGSSTPHVARAGSPFRKQRWRRSSR